MEHTSFRRPSASFIPKPFCLFTAKQVVFHRDITQPFQLTAATDLPLNRMLCVIKIKFSSVLIIKVAPSTGSIFVPSLLSSQLADKVPDRSRPGLFERLLTGAGRRYWRLLLLEIERLEETKTGAGSRERRHWWISSTVKWLLSRCVVMKNDWFENYCWAFPLNHRRLGKDDYLHNLTGVLIIMSAIGMQMT